MNSLFDLSMHFRFAGVVLLALAAVHFAFPRWFNWKEELARLSLLNRQIFVVHTYFIMLTVSLFGLLSLVMTEDLLSGSRLARAVLLGMAVFWGFRLYCQFCIYSPELWRGRRLNTLAHLGAALLWFYLTVICAIALAAAPIGISNTARG